jgi:hypothetical protein|tara:strand:+ start:803 stop:3856 length:3054 start_codon:yes stop_codon:yes gene_type:complete
MPAINLKAAATSKVTSAVTASVSTVSDAVGAKVEASISGKIPGGSLSTNKVGAALLGGAIGGLLDGAKGAAIGGLLGGSGLLGLVENKLKGLIGDAPELLGLKDTPLKIVEKGAAELQGLVGEAFSLTTSQYKNTKNNTAFNLIDDGPVDIYNGNDTSASKIPNPLRKYESFNYKITLGILDTEEYNNPEKYRNAGGFKNYIIQSSGGDLGKRYQVADEHAGNVAGAPQLGHLGSQTHAEYYIDDLNVDAVIAPNPNTRVALGTSIEFNVLEPYSMGNFIQAIVGSASVAGYKNYLDAPFCLKIEFVGWEPEGAGTRIKAPYEDRPIFMPIKFINMEFSVSGSGSSYAVKAIPMSEAGLSDQVNKIKTPVKTSGTFLHEVLETNDNSLTTAINGHLQGLEVAGAIAPSDRYLIVFPKESHLITDALNKGTVTDTAFTTSPEELAQQKSGSVGSMDAASKSAQYSEKIITITPPSNTYAVLKTFAEDITLMNAIGTSSLNEDTNAAGNKKEADPDQVVNPVTQKVDRSAIGAQAADKAREYMFSQNEKITNIIEQLVVQTEYAAENSTEESKNGLNKWFKINTFVFIDDNPLSELQQGQKPKVYVYSVETYEVDSAVTVGHNKTPKNTNGLKQEAVKAYNYIYTGKNEDILSFDINFNNAFMSTALANYGANAGTVADVDSGTITKPEQDGAGPSTDNDAETKEEASGGTQTDTRVANPAGTRSADIRRQVAEMFHDRITNLPIDMISAEMEIYGDPFFVPQEIGNYVAKTGFSPQITADGTMPYHKGPVFLDVNFRTPFDYQIKGATMEMPIIVPQFSGLFQAWAVTNSFSKGQFKQNLKLIRRKKQNDAATSGNTAFINVNGDIKNGKDQVRSDGTVGAQRPGIDCIPAPVQDDIRIINPAIAADITAGAEAALKEMEGNLANIGSKIKSEIAGVDFGLVKVQDLTKVISGGFIPTSGSPFADAFGNYTGSAALTSATDNIREYQSTIANNAATAGINAATNAGKVKIKSLLKGPR